MHAPVITNGIGRRTLDQAIPCLWHVLFLYTISGESSRFQYYIVSSHVLLYGRIYSESLSASAYWSLTRPPDLKGHCELRSQEHPPGFQDSDWCDQDGETLPSLSGS